jgi:hypothetical protein
MRLPLGAAVKQREMRIWRGIHFRNSLLGDLDAHEQTAARRTRRHGGRGQAGQ